MNVPEPRNDRGPLDLRRIGLDRGASPFAEGSCLVSFGRTRVLCTASVEAGVPGWKKGTGNGWITAEYAMLPRATHTRAPRERVQLGHFGEADERTIKGPGQRPPSVLGDIELADIELGNIERGASETHSGNL